MNTGWNRFVGDFIHGKSPTDTSQVFAIAKPGHACTDTNTHSGSVPAKAQAVKVDADRGRSFPQANVKTPPTHSWKHKDTILANPSPK